MKLTDKKQQMSDKVIVLQVSSQDQQVQSPRGQIFDFLGTTGS